MHSKHDGTIKTRFLDQGDRPNWQVLWNGYLEFYEAELSAHVTEVTWNRFLDPDEPVFALGAFGHDQLLGIVHFVTHRATWTTSHYVYLEDLFTEPKSRGKGVGEKLVEAVYEEADRIGAARVYWHTHQTNLVARRLYDRVGHNAGFIQYRRPA